MLFKLWEVLLHQGLELETEDLEATTVTEIEDILKAVLAQDGHHHPEGLLPSLQIQKYGACEKVHALDVSHLDVLLCEGVKHVKELLLPTLGCLEI